MLKGPGYRLPGLSKQTILDLNPSTLGRSVRTFQEVYLLPTLLPGPPRPLFLQNLVKYEALGLDVQKPRTPSQVPPEGHFGLLWGFRG